VVNILAIAGYPCTGKTTFMRELIEALGGLPDRSERKRSLLEYHLIHPTATTHGDVVVFGKYSGDDTFGGTDKLSMAVEADAEDFISRPPAGINAVMFEGDRLATAAFLRHINSTKQPLRLIVLKIEDALLKERRADREFAVGKSQDATWLKGRESKVDTLAQNFFGELKYIDTEEQITLHIEELKKWLLGASPATTKKPGRLF